MVSNVGIVPCLSSLVTSLTVRYILLFSETNIITSSVPKWKITFRNLIRLRMLVKLVINTWYYQFILFLTSCILSIFGDYWEIFKIWVRQKLKMHEITYLLKGPSSWFIDSYEIIYSPTLCSIHTSPLRFAFLCLNSISWLFVHVQAKKPWI